MVMIIKRQCINDSKHELKTKELHPQYPGSASLQVHQA